MRQSSEHRRAELLMPAGSLSKLKTAILYGADAVYAGTPDLSLRTQSSFNLDELIEGVNFTHRFGKRFYLTLNLFAHNKDVEKLPNFVETVREVNPDGVIVSDQGVFHYLRENAPELELHVSTQANACSWLTVQSWQKQGAALCVLAREVSFTELEEIRKKCPDIKLEIFVHGAMCMTYSGRCLLSNYLAERGANQGNCAHSCRWNYKVLARTKEGVEVTITPDNKNNYDFFLEEQYRPGEFMKIEEDDSGSYILNSKDLCLMPKLNEYLSLGLDSLKIEGRNKSQYYVAVTARAYRRAIDSWYDSPKDWRPEKFLRELYTLQNRGYSLGFHEGRLTNLSHNYDRTETVGVWLYGGVITCWENNDIIFLVRNPLVAGVILEFLSPFEFKPIRLRLYDFTDAKTGVVKNKVAPGHERSIRIPTSAFNNESSEFLKNSLPSLSVARVSAELSKDRQILLESNLVSFDVERGLQGLSKDRPTVKGRVHTGKPPKLGIEGCCGLGCNGCLMFWNDPKYTKARENMKSR